MTESPLFNVRIKKCSLPSFWYNNLIGEVWQVRNHDYGYKTVKSIPNQIGVGVILKSDCEIIVSTEGKKVLDVCCGPKGMWFDKNDTRALYIDNRCENHKNNYPSGEKKLEVKPDVIGDFTDIQQPNESFFLVVFDPPHIKRDSLGEITKRYGALKGDWEEMIRKGFSECFRVLKPNGVLIFKWCEVQFPIKDILKLTDQKPLFGHKSGKKMQTHWVSFIKGV